MRLELSQKYIRGSGLELGALHCPTPVNPGVLVTYVDRDPDIVREAHKDVRIAIPSWVVDDAAELRHFGPMSQDFIIANHVLEHLTNPIKAFFTWVDRLRPNGILFISLPDKGACFDRNRASTTFEHLLADWIMPDSCRDFEHYLDWYLNSELERLPLEKAKISAKQAWGISANIHFHVWSVPAMLDFMGNLTALSNGSMKDVEVVVSGGEVIFILRKNG